MKFWGLQQNRKAAVYPSTCQSLGYPALTHAHHFSRVLTFGQNPSLLFHSPALWRALPALRNASLRSTAFPSFSPWRCCSRNLIPAHLSLPKPLFVAHHLQRDPPCTSGFPHSVLCSPHRTQKWMMFASRSLVLRCRVWDSVVLWQGVKMRPSWSQSPFESQL